MTKAERRVFERGKRHRRQGLTLADNPHKADGDKRRLWMEGWKEQDLDIEYQAPF